MTDYDILIRGGKIYDGTGSLPLFADIGINGDIISEIGNLKHHSGKVEVNVPGLAVAPGFINMLSWALDSLIEDGRSLGDIKQGVTLEVFGEGWSYGPLSDSMKQEMLNRQTDIKFSINWTTLGEFLAFLEKKGISTNVGSFLGATTTRINILGYENRAPTENELVLMRKIVDDAMQEGAFGVASALIYAPGIYAETKELIELCKVVSKYDGLYASHIRSEGSQFLESLDEFFTIIRQANVRGEIYHLKAAGSSNWHKMEDALKKIETAQKMGLLITANCYPYTAAATGLEDALPPWVHEGGHEKFIQRLQNPKIREQIKSEILNPQKEWENMYKEGGPNQMQLVGFKSDKLKPLMGQTLAEIAKERKADPLDTAMDLIIEDDSRIITVYHLMTEENVRKIIPLPYMSYGSDEGSYAPEGIFLKSSCHPRAYGTFSRILGKYCRDEVLVSLEEAIRKLTSLPAHNLRIKNRGLLKRGYFADVVIFDPQLIRDNATYKNPHQLSSGIVHVFVNGVQVLKNGTHTNASPGRVVRGPGWNTEHTIK